MELINDFKKYQNEIIEFVSNWKEELPKLLRFKTFDEFIDNTNSLLDNEIPHSTFFLFVENKIIGFINIRHTLNKHYLETMGHIGLYILKEERNKNYGSYLFKKAIEECKKLNITKILIVCSNINSERIVLKNGGVLENIVIDKKGLELKRYWINGGSNGI